MLHSDGLHGVAVKVSLLLYVEYSIVRLGTKCHIRMGAQTIKFAKCQVSEMSTCLGSIKLNLLQHYI